MHPIHKKILARHNRIAQLLSLRFFWVLMLLGSFILLAGERPPTHVGRSEDGVVLIVILTFVAYATRASRRRFLVTLALNALPLFAWIFFLFNPSRIAQLQCYIALTACLLFAIWCTLEFVLVEGAISSEHIIGAICAYIMIAMFFATLYTINWAFNPNAFNGVAPDTPRPWGDLLYFSFTTLSTVGYGDISPAAPMSRGATMVEQLTGTFYLAILIARLTGLYPQPEKPQTTDTKK